MWALACSIPVVLICGTEDTIDRAVDVEESSPRVPDRASLWSVIRSSLSFSRKILNSGTGLNSAGDYIIDGSTNAVDRAHEDVK